MSSVEVYTPQAVPVRHDRSQPAVDAAAARARFRADREADWWTWAGNAIEAVANKL